MIALVQMLNKRTHFVVLYMPALAWAFYILYVYNLYLHAIGCIRWNIRILQGLYHKENPPPLQSTHRAGFKPRYQQPSIRLEHSCE
jgi:hypothetical protein